MPTARTDVVGVIAALALVVLETVAFVGFGCLRRRSHRHPTAAVRNRIVAAEGERVLRELEAWFVLVEARVGSVACHRAGARRNSAVRSHRLVARCGTGRHAAAGRLAWPPAMRRVPGR